MERFDRGDCALALIEQYQHHPQPMGAHHVRAHVLKLPEAERLVATISRACVLRCTLRRHAPMPVKQQMIEWWGPVIHEYYAGTEGNGSTAINSEEWLQHKGSVGKPQAVQVHILDDDGNELSPGEAGGIYFEGGGEFEYHNDPDKTRGSHTEQGWSTLGDIGYLDDDGYLYLTDRKAFMIIRGGVNIYPQEAENVLITHPLVYDCAVIGVPHPDLGEVVKGVVQPMPGTEISADLEQELIEYCHEHLARYKCPESIDFEAELPRHPTGKLYKRLIKDRYWGKHDTRIV